MSASTCFVPFLGGTNFSTRSVKMMSPMRSLFLMAENASSAAISAATSRLACSREPNAPEPDASTSSITVISRSSTNSLM